MTVGLLKYPKANLEVEWHPTVPLPRYFVTWATSHDLSINTVCITHHFTKPCHMTYPFESIHLVLLLFHEEADLPVGPNGVGIYLQTLWMVQ